MLSFGSGCAVRTAEVPLPLFDYLRNVFGMETGPVFIGALLRHQLLFQGIPLVSMTYVARLRLSDDS